MTEGARVPDVLWAERKDKIFITIEVPDCKDAKVDITEEGKLTFSGKGGTDNAPYACELQLMKPVDSKASKVAIIPRHIVLVVMKAESGPHWGKLLKGPGKPPHFVKADWSKYKDEDEEDAEMDAGFDMSQLDDLTKFGGGNFGGGDDDDDDDEDDDSDDDDLPDLQDSSVPK